MWRVPYFMWSGHHVWSGHLRTSVPRWSSKGLWLRRPRQHRGQLVPQLLHASLAEEVRQGAVRVVWQEKHRVALGGP